MRISDAANRGIATQRVCRLVDCAACRRCIGGTYSPLVRLADKRRARPTRVEAVPDRVETAGDVVPPDDKDAWHESRNEPFRNARRCACMRSAHLAVTPAFACFAFREHCTSRRPPFKRRRIPECGPLRRVVSRHFESTQPGAACERVRGTRVLGAQGRKRMSVRWELSGRHSVASSAENHFVGGRDCIRIALFQRCIKSASGSHKSFLCRI